MLRPMINGQIFFYCENNMECYQIRQVNNIKRDSTSIDITMLEDITTKAMVIPNDYVTADFEVGECLVRLDDTTMKRIAEYNLGKELKSLNKKVKNRKDELAQLEKEIEIRNKKLETIENLMETIWQDDEFDTKNYIPRSPYEDEYDDFDEEDY